jgi:hypothetical protein
MKITKTRLRQIIKESFDEFGMSEYGLYNDAGSSVEAEFDTLLDEVALFMSDARKRLNALMEKHSDVGASDSEAVDLISAAFEDAVAGRR